MTKPHLDRRAIVLLTLLCLAWGLNTVAIKVANAGIPLVVQALLRSLLATVIVGLYAKARGLPLLRRDASTGPGIACGVPFGLDFVAFTGMALGLADGLRVGGGTLAADLVCVFGAILWAATTLVIKATALVGESAERILFYQLAWSVPVMVLAASLFGPVGVVQPSGLVVVCLAYQVVIVVAITYLG